MDIPYALQQYLQADSGVQSCVRAGVSWPAHGQGGVFMFQLDESVDLIMPVECVLLRSAGGLGGFSTLELNDQHMAIGCYGGTSHLAWNLDSAVYTALKNLTPSVWAKTYLHWAKASTRGNAVVEPTTQWPLVISVWQIRASDLTIAA